MMKLFAVILVAFALVPSEEAFKIKPRIVNGFIAAQEDFPHYVFLDIVKSESFSQCGGTILNDEFILTAAHCIANDTISEVKVRFISDDLRRPHEVVSVGKNSFFIHPDFDLQNPYHDDIALIRLPEKVQFTPYVQPVTLPTTCETTEIENVYAMGNGLTSSKGEMSFPLKFTVLKTLPFATCLQVFPSMWRESLICAVDQEAPLPMFASSIHRGDSGSPLTKSDGTLIGVASFAHLEADPRYPQAFTRVSSFSKWINNVAGLNLPEC